MAITDGLPDGQQPNDDARPDAGAPGAPAAPAAPPPAPAASSTDPDLAELEAARAAVAAERAGAAAEPGPSPTPTTPAAAAAPAAPAAPQGQEGNPPAQPGDTPTIPLPRFQQVNAERQRLAEENLYLKGVVDAVRSGALPAAPAPGTAPPAQPQPPTIAEQVQAKRLELKGLAEKYDAGEISFPDFEAARGQIEDTIVDLRVQAQVAARTPPPPAPTKSLADEAIEQDQMRKLEERHPIVLALTAQQAATLAQIAHVEAAGRGQPYGQSLRETMRLREHVAKLAEQFAPAWGLKAPAPAAAPAAATPPAPGARALSPEAQARLAKIDMANGLPPDTAQFGTAAQQDQITPQMLDAMSDEAIMAIPAATRARLYAQG